MTEVFWTFFITSMIGLLIAMGRMLYKSKCKEVSMGCFKVIRDTETEEKEYEFNNNHNIKNEDNI